LKEIRNPTFWLKQEVGLLLQNQTFCGLGAQTCKHELKLKEKHERAKLWEYLTGLAYSKKLTTGKEVKKL